MSITEPFSIKPEQWMKDALCREVGGEIWWPVKGESTAATAAKRICKRCPVVAECLEWAIRIGDDNGVLGGMTAHDRAIYRRQLRRGKAA